MSLPSIDAHILKQSNLKGYFPRMGIEIAGIGQNFSANSSFDVRIDAEADGDTDVAKPTRFESATMDTTQVLIGDVLTITGGANAGVYPITAIASPTRVNCASATFVNGSGQVWEIDRPYQGILSLPPKVKQYAKELGGFSPTQDLGFGVMNNELFSDVLATYPDMALMEVNIFEYFDDGLTINLSERLQLYSGLVKDTPSLNYKSMQFNVTDSNQLLDKQIGTLLEGSDGADGATLPDEALGQIKPIIYGDHRNLYGAATGTTDAMTCDKDNNMVPMILLGVNSANQEKWMMAGHEVLTTLNTTDLVWAWDSTLGRFVENTSTPVAMTNNNTDGATFSYQANSNRSYRDILLGDGTTSNNADVGAATWTNDTYAVDSDAATPAVSTIGAGWSALVQARVDLDFDATYTNDRTIGTVGLYIKFSLTRGAGLAAGQLHLLVDGNELNAHANAGIKTIFIANVGAGGDAAMQQSITIAHYRDISAGATETVATIYEVWKKGVFSSYEYMPLYSSIKGREYDTWIDDRDVVDGYSEAHIDSNGSGTLIENAAGVVESLFRDELGMGNEAGVGPSDDTDLLRDSFNIASNDLSTSILSLAIHGSPEPWFTPMTKLLTTVKSLTDIDATGLTRMLVFGGPVGFSASGDTKPSNRDIFDYNPNTVFVIEASVNDKLYFTHPGPGSISTTLTAGTYTASALASMIQTNLSVIIGGSTCTYSSTTGKFTVTVVAGTSLDWSTTSRQVGRFIGFQTDTDTAAGTDTSDYPLWDLSYLENPIIQNSFSMVGQKETLVTDVTVEYVDNGAFGLQKDVNDSDVTIHSEVIAKTYKNPYTRDLTTATIHLDHLLDRLHKKHWRAKFKTFFNAIHLQKWDVINIRHPIIEGMYTESVMNSKKWAVINLSYDFKRSEITIDAIEVD
jgi:hypothetical protein